jgi:hypothetical protein
VPQLSCHPLGGLKNMQTITLQEIKNRVEELAQKINAPNHMLPSYGSIKYDALPYIEIDNLGLMYYVVFERGLELERKMTDQLDELLFWIFAPVTFWMASQYELEHRNTSQDSRRIMFSKQLELLGQLSEKWKVQEQEEHQRILRVAPYSR